MVDPNLLVGVETSDDAAVYKISDDVALIQTLDFFTPIVDDPYTFGEIAAANSLSDVYAMGGTPIVALNIVCFPSCLPMDVLGDILKGGADKVIEAGAVIVGGHSVDDNEPKYGLSVTGTVHPQKILKNYGCKKGDLLLLTKPLGTGIINTAIKGGIASEPAYDKAVRVMTTLNKYVSQIMSNHKINACTDITGFGLMGHAFEMASASDVELRIYKNNIPYIKEAEEYANMGLVPAGSYKNRDYIKGKYVLKDTPDWMEDIIFDPQTSGGLLISCPESEAYSIINESKDLDFKPVIIGEAAQKRDNSYIVVK